MMIGSVGISGSADKQRTSPQDPRPTTNVQRETVTESESGIVN
jgi:hypothetical protein